MDFDTSYIIRYKGLNVTQSGQTNQNDIRPYTAAASGHYRSQPGECGKMGNWCAGASRREPKNTERACSEGRSQETIEGAPMEIEVKRIDKNLYRRQYQTGNGEWTTLYYAAFVDWTGKRRTFALGADLKTARQELAVKRADNIRKKDFDA